MTYKLHNHRPKNVLQIHREENYSSFNNKLAIFFTKAFGSVWAFYILVTWMFLWMALSGIGFWLFKYDQYPFPFLLFCSNLIQLWALPVIMVGQNVLNKHQELQSEEAFHIAEKSFYDVEQIMSCLEEQNRLLKQISGEAQIDKVKDSQKKV
jgi:uncharacterized membrane protein